jgi:hypothetical protein
MSLQSTTCSFFSRWIFFFTSSSHTFIFEIWENQWPSERDLPWNA